MDQLQSLYKCQKFSLSSKLVEEELKGLVIQTYGLDSLHVHEQSILHIYEKRQQNLLNCL